MCKKERESVCVIRKKGIRKRDTLASYPSLLAQIYFFNVSDKHINALLLAQKGDMLPIFTHYKVVVPDNTPELIICEMTI